MAFNYGVFTKDKVYNLIERAQSGDGEALEMLVECNGGLVKKIALKYTGCGYELEDLIQIGYIGLIKAIDKFDIDLDYMFSTYAVPMIIGEIKRHVRDDGKIKVSRDIKQEVNQMKKIETQLAMKLGRAPKISELAEAMDKTCERIIELVDAADVMNNIGSYETLMESGGMVEKKSDIDNPENRIDNMILESAMEKLPVNSQRLIGCRYFKDMTQQETAKVMGMTQVQVSRMEKKVIINLKKLISEQM